MQHIRWALYKRYIQYLQLAPQVTKHEDFEAHWRAITETMSMDTGECLNV